MANKTANEKILDNFVRHHIYVLDYARTVRDRSVRPLLDSEAEVKVALLKLLSDLGDENPLSPQVRKLFKQLTKEVTEIRTGAWEKTEKIAKAELAAVSLAEASFVESAVTRALPVQLLANTPSTKTLSDIVDKLPFEGATLAEWIVRSKRNDISRIIRTAKIGVTHNESHSEIVRRVMGDARLKKHDGVVGRAWADTEALAYTATTAVSHQARDEFYSNNETLIQEEYFVATLDSRTTFQCAGLDGERYKRGTGPRPPLHFRCRSLRIPFFSPDDLSKRGFDPSTETKLMKSFMEKEGVTQIKQSSVPEKYQKAREAYLSKNKDSGKSRAKLTREWADGAGVKLRPKLKLPHGYKTKYNEFARKERRKLIGQVPGKTTFSEWLKNQTEDFQNEYLGPKRAKLFRSGKFTLDKFTLKSGDVIPLETLSKNF